MADIAHVCTATLTVTQVAELVKSLLGEPSPPALVRRVDAAELMPFTPNVPTDWPEGQVFGPGGDLRWRRVGDGCAVLLLTENAPPSGYGLTPLPGSTSLAVDAKSIPGQHLLLWGTRAMPSKDDPSQQVWWETRIPRPLRYPGDWGSKPPRLQFRFYRDPQSRAVRWTRFVALVKDS